MGMRIALAIAGLVALGGRARADGQADTDARAKVLFDEGVALRAASPDQACAKFEASRQLNPAALGTLINVAKCAEDRGRVATAVVRFGEVLDRAKEVHDDDFVKAAEEAIGKLTPLVPHLTITFAEPPDADTKLVVDDIVVPLDAIASVPVDPGEREVVVSAPRRIPYRGKIVLAPSEHRSLEIPALAKSIVVTSSRRRIGMITAAAGAAALGTGVGIGIYAWHKWNAQFDSGACSHSHTTGTGTSVMTVEQNTCTDEGLRQVNRARTLGNVGTIVGGVGLVAIGVGAYLWIWGPKSTAPTEPVARWTPVVAPGQIGFAVSGGF